MAVGVLLPTLGKPLRYRALQIAAVILAYVVFTALPVLARPQAVSADDPAVREFFDAGETSFLKGDYKKALRAYSKAFELSEKRSMISLYGLGKTYLRMSKFEEAEECGERILELDDREVNQAAAENLIGSALLGRALGSQGNRDRPELLTEAESHLRASLDISSGQMSIAWFNLSVALQEQDRLGEARDAQQEYVYRTPENRPARARLCGLQYLVQSASEDPARVTASQVDQPVAEEQEPTPGTSALDKSQESPVQKPLKVEGRVSPPEKLHAPMPQYTQIARDARLQGAVIIEAIIDKEGNVTSVKVLKGLPMGLDRAAALAVCHWQFKPATLNGKPVAVIYNMTANFRLK